MAHLIKVGWDNATTSQIRAWQDDIARAPFDGQCVLVDARNAATVETGKLSRDGWAKKLFNWEEFEAAQSDLAECKLDLSHSFVSFNCGPGDIDWFDNFDSVLGNLTIAAKLARVTGMRGIWLDTETYVQHIWDLSTRPQKATKLWAGYKLQARQRGKEVMAALLSVFPEITLILSLGNSWVAANRGTVAVESYRYALLVPFIDGLLDAGPKPGQLVDGNERTYGWTHPFDLIRAVDNARVNGGALAADPVRFKSTFSIALATWMDNNRPTAGWNVADFSSNYFKPAQLERTLSAALAVADDYVWLYSEDPKWWGPAGPEKLPYAYDLAVRRAVSAGVEVKR